MEPGVVTWLVNTEEGWGPHGTDLVLAGTCLEIWSFHKQAVWWQQGRGLCGEVWDSAFGHLFCSWAPSWASTCILGS